MSTTEPQEAGDDSEELELYGYPGYVFYLIHITALVSLSTSVVVSTGVIIYFFTSNRHKCHIWQRPIGERLVLYLAIADLGFSTSHTLDHAYMMAVVDHPPDDICFAFAAILVYFVQLQMCIVIFTAVNLCVLVVKEIKLNLGKYDWRLMMFALGIPALVSGGGRALRFWGPTGAW